MMEFIAREAMRTGFDLAPILVVIGFFALRFLPPDKALRKRALTGAAYIAIGLTLFRVGLETALLPLAGSIARDLAADIVESGGAAQAMALIGFAVAMGATAALIEPTMAATADRVRDLTGGSVRPMVLRLAVATGFGLGLGFGGMRLVYGLPLGAVVAPLVGVMTVLALVAPKRLTPLALDSGAIATSVVTVPIIAVFGVAVAETLPGRSPLADGFGMIVLAMIGSSVSVLLIATLVDRFPARRPGSRKDEGDGE